MNATRVRRRRFFGAVMLAGAVLTLADSRSDGAPDLPVMVQVPAARVRLATATPFVAATEPRSTLELPQRADPDGDGENLFARHSWYVEPPPPQPPPPAEPAAPTAPPLPFTFMGRYAEDGGPTVYFLQQGDRVHDVREGDVIDGTYVIGGESGGQLMLTYLPMDTQQSLAVGPSS